MIGTGPEPPHGSGGLELPEGWGIARLPRGRAAADRRGARSYDHRGTALVWHPGPACAGAMSIACDLEHAARFAAPVRVPGGPAGGVRLEWWVATEVIAKLMGQPVLAFLRAHGVISSFATGSARLDLAPFGFPGSAHLVIARSDDGAHGAAFGLRLSAGRS